MTREEAIHFAECLKKNWTINFADMEEFCDMAIEALSVDRPTEWIPASERMPIPPTFCLVTTDGSHGDVIDIALYMSDGWHKASDVIAWMPLPEPYKGGGTGE